MTEETQIKKAVRDWLDWHGWFHFHLMAGMGVYPGAPDRIAVKGGRVVFLEIKAPGKNQSPAQYAFGMSIGKAGGEYHVIHDLDELETCLER